MRHPAIEFLLLCTFKRFFVYRIATAMGGLGVDRRTFPGQLGSIIRKVPVFNSNIPWGTIRPICDDSTIFVSFLPFPSDNNNVNNFELIYSFVCLFNLVLGIVHFRWHWHKAYTECDAKINSQIGTHTNKQKNSYSQMHCNVIVSVYHRST